MHAVPPGPGPMLSDLEARAYAHLAAARGDGAHPGVMLSPELCRELLACLDELNDRRSEGIKRLEARGAERAADSVRAQADDVDAPLSDVERAEALGRRIDFALVGGSNLELAELTNAYVALRGPRPFGDLPTLEPQELDASTAIIDAAVEVRDVIVGQGIGVDDLGARLGPFTEALNTLGEAVDVWESLR